MPTPKNCPAGVAANGKAETAMINLERLHHDVYQLVAELRAMITEVDRRLDGRITEISTDLDRLEGQLSD